ncbi:MAG: FtsX-like permease family protein, partial [Acidobacteriota bacterium]|nr:FtsX-like permease family protein [Acidobacteriota bacterium]
MSLAIRTEGDPLSYGEAVRRAVWAVDPDQAISQIQTLRQLLESSLAGPRVIGQGVAVVGAAAVVLSAIGMFGLISYDVGQRRREIGIRVAMGASPRQVIRGVTYQGLSISGLGLLIGLPLAWGMFEMIGAAFQDLLPMHVGTLAGLVGLLVVVSCFASYLPARRAARIQPSQVLQLD